MLATQHHAALTQLLSALPLSVVKKLKEASGAQDMLQPLLLTASLKVHGVHHSCMVVDIVAGLVEPASTPSALADAQRLTSSL